VKIISEHYIYEDFSKRYPIEMHKYAQSAGALFAHRIGRIFEILGFTTWIVKGQNNGIDIKVYHESNLILVCELLNWSPYTRLSEKRKAKLLNNLTRAEFSGARKVLIYTAMKDETVLNDLWLYDVETIKIGTQILPKYFHRYYAIKKQIVGRAIDSTESTNLVTEKLSAYIKDIRFD